MSDMSEKASDGKELRGREGSLRLLINKDTLIDLTPEQEQVVRDAMVRGQRMRACVIYENGDTTRYCKAR